MLDTKALAAAMAPIVREAVDKAVKAAEAPLLQRIEALEKRAPEKGEPGRDGSPGKDGQNGADGVPGRDGVDGQKGEPGNDGRDGADGKDCDMDAVLARVDEFLKTIPVPENGKDGRDGIDGKDGMPGEKGEPGHDGENGKDGVDGVGLAGALIDRDGVLNLTLTNGEVKALGHVVGRDGKDGERGADGQAWTAMDVARTGPRTIELSFEHGDQRNTYEMEFPVPVYRGVFAEGENYVEGDMVTFAGSLWHANEATSLKPGEGAKAWTLAAKRGRDGKDFAGPQAKAPPTVRV